MSFLCVRFQRTIIQQPCQENVYLRFPVRSDSKMYHTITAAKPLTFKKTRSGIDNQEN